MAEVRARKKLEEISAAKGNRITVEQLLTIFKNQAQKYTNERILQFAQNNIKNHLLDGDKMLAQMETNVRKHQKTPYEALVIMLNNATVIQPSAKPPIAEKPNLTRMSQIESPALSSTRFDQNTPEIVVSEIKERLAQVTQQNTTKQSTTLRPSLNSSSGSAINAIKHSAFKQPPPVLQTINPVSAGTFVFTNDILLPFQRIPKPLVGLPVPEQERAIITDLLYTLVGINADLIKPKLEVIINDDYTLTSNEGKRANVEFEVDDQVSDSVKDIIKDILPLANLYCQLQCFIDYARARESGQVLQALSEACGKLIEDYIVTISQLEAMHNKRELNLQKMLFFLRPILQTMETVVHICISIQDRNIRGGIVLTMLHDSISLSSGDKNSQKIIIHLTQRAAVPYMEILSHWVFKGIIHDPRQEFFVEDHENELITSSQTCYLDEFWEKRFALHEDRIPRFLEKQADIILKTGKYLNVIRECGKRITFSQADTILKFSHTDEQHYVTLINDAYAFASKSCLELIMDDYDLMGHLLSVKRYFLLQQGDFIVQYLDACENELSKGVDDVMPIRLENLLELTLRMSSAKFDKYQDNLSTMLMPFDLVTQMSKITKSTGSESDDYDLPDMSTLSGIECFAFGYKTTWPISIVLHEMTISKYQIIFRQLFYCKYVENYLCRVWLGNNNAKKFDLETSEQYRAAFTLRQRMMNTIQNLEYYMMIEVIEPVWLVFMQQITKAKNIDEVLYYHEDFLDHCLKNCMLCLPDILKVIVKICNLCLDFCKFIEEAQRHFIDAELSSMLSKNYLSDDNLVSHVDEEQNQSKPETFSQKVSKYDAQFTQATVALLIKIQEIAEKAHSEKFVSLIHRINFNNFYSDKLTSTE